MRKFALISAAVMMSVGSVGSAAAVVAPVAVTAASASGVSSNRLALGLAQPADDDTSGMASDSGGIGATEIAVGIGATVAIGLGVWAATTHTRTRPTSS